MLLSAALPFSAAQAQSRAAVERTLDQHGVVTTPDGLADFLEQGWRGAAPPKVLPGEPADKAALIPQAWMLATLQYDILGETPGLDARLGVLALRYATRDFPSDVRAILDRDIDGLDPAVRAQARHDQERLLQYNGMVALGVFGDPSDATRHAAREVYLLEESPIVAVSYAQALGLLGDATVLEDLVAVVAGLERAPCVAAAEALHILTGRSFGIHANLAIGPRREAAKQLIDWWLSQEKGAVQIDHEAALARYLRPPAPPRRRALRTIHDLLRASADVADTTDARGSRTAWEQLKRMGDSLPEHLELILKDPDEDLDVRAEAIRWTVRLNGVKKAKRQLKKLRKDPNPEIAAMAESILKSQ